MQCIFFGSKDVQNSGQKLNDWGRRSPLQRLIERVQRLLRVRTDPRWMLFALVLFLALLSGCAAKPPLCPQVGRPPPELMVAPPPPGATMQRLETILQQGRTSAPTSTP